jgi:hypothetical protein
VLIARLVDIKKETKVTPGSEELAFVPISAYPIQEYEDDLPPPQGPYYGNNPIPYQPTMYGQTVVRLPPTTVTTLKVSIEMRLFDAAAATMVWNGVTSSGTVADLEKATEEFARQIIQALVRDGVI